MIGSFLTNKVNSCLVMRKIVWLQRKWDQDDGEVAQQRGEYVVGYLYKTLGGLCFVGCFMPLGKNIASCLGDEDIYW